MNVYRLLRYVGCALIVLAFAQLVFAASCFYMVAAIEDDVWRGVRLDDLGATAATIGAMTGFASFFALLGSWEIA